MLTRKEAGWDRGRDRTATATLILGDITARVLECRLRVSEGGCCAV